MTTEQVRVIKAIMEDAQASNKYLKESGDTTSARARRSLQIVLNVSWLLTNEVEAVQDVLLLQSMGELYDLGRVF